MSENQPKLKFEEDKERAATRSPPKKKRVEQTTLQKKKLKLDADKVKEKAQHLRFGKVEITPDEASRMTKAQKLRAAYLYVRDHGAYLARPHQARGTTDWAEESALFMFEHKKGNCYCFAG